MAIITQTNALGAALSLSATVSVDNVEALKQLGIALGALTPEKIAHLAATTNLNRELIEEALLQADVDSEVFKSITDYLDATAAKGADAAATNTLTISMGNLLTAIKANTVAMATWMATNPIGWVLAIAAAIGVTVGAVSLYNKHIDKTIDEAKELQNQFKETNDAILGNISTVQKMDAEFTQLAKGVDDYGNNISLTADEYERYKQLVSDLVAINPAVVRGYNTEGQAIIDKNTALRETIELLERQRQLELMNATSSESNWTIAEGLRNEYKRAAADVDEAAEEMLTSLQQGFAKVFTSGVNGSAIGIGGHEAVKAFNDLVELFDLSEHVDMAAGTVSLQKWNSLFQSIKYNSDDYAKVINDNLGLFNDLISGDNTAVAEFSRTVQQWVGATNRAETAAKSYQSQMMLIAQAATGYDELNDASKRFINEWISTWEFTGDENQDSIDALTSQIWGIVGELSSSNEGKALQSQLASLFKIDWGALSGEAYVAQRKYVEQILEAIASFLNVAPDSDIMLDLRIALGLDVIDPTTGQTADPRTAIINQLRERGLDLSAGDLNGFTLAELEILLTTKVDGIKDVDALNAALAETQRQAAALVADLSFTDIYSKVETQLSALTDAHTEMAEAGYLSADAVKALEAAGLEEYLVGMEDSYHLVQGALDDYIDAQRVEYEFALNEAVQAAQHVIDDSALKAAGYNTETLAIYDKIKAMRELAAAEMAEVGNAFIRRRLATGDTSSEANHMLSSNEEYMAAFRYWQQIDSMVDNIDNAQNNLDDYNRIINMYRKELGGASSTVEIYIAEINKLYDAERRLADLQQDYDLIDADKALLDEDDLDGQVEKITDMIALLREQNEVLHEQNNIRDQIVQDEIDRIQDIFADQGLTFEIDFDPVNNKLNIKDWEKVNQLVGATDDETNELRKSVEAALQEMEDYVDASADNSLQWRKNLKTINDLLDEIQDSLQSVRDEQKEQLEQILDLTIELVKQEAEDMKDALSQEIEDYRTIIEMKKSMLQLMQREKSYADSIAEKTAKLAKIEQKLAALKLDDSREARLEEAALLEERKELAKSIADEQNEHYVSSTEDALDKELEAYETQKDKEIEALDEFLDDQQRLTQEALSRLDNMNESLFISLQSYVLKYTETSSAEFQSMWDDAMAAAQEYGNFTKALAETSVEVGRADAVDAAASSIVSKMEANGAAWHTASGDAQGALVRQNEEYADQLRALFAQNDVSATITKSNGVWYIDGEELFKKYHTGTASVGTTPTARQSETLALLENREMVLTQKHQDVLWQMLQTWAPLRSLNERLPHFAGVAAPSLTQMGHTIKVEAPIYMTGNLTDETLRVLKEHSYTVASLVSKQLNKL